MTKRPVAIDLFCGAGGMSLGFEQAGFDVLLGVERDGYHVATHERNFPYGKTLCQSVADLKLGGTILCTPAISNGSIYLRSDQHLWKIGGK